MKKNVGIIFGGPSAEHEVSLQSANNIIAAIDQEKFNISLIGIDKQGNWQINEKSNFLLHADNPALIALNPLGQPVALMPGQTQMQLQTTTQQPLAQLDVVFPIVHGNLGEDGSIQGLLKTLNLPFVGSHVLGSALCMDKDVAKRLLYAAGLKVAPFIKLTARNVQQFDFETITQQLGTPIFIKPANQGSSVGVSKVHTAEQFAAALQLAFSYDDKVLVEKSIVGREIECAILGNQQPIASVCGELTYQGLFYAYDTKYIEQGSTQLHIPASLPETIAKRLQATALAAYDTLECLGMARVDMFLTEDNQIFINEVNTLPGFTQASMYPKLWEASGLSYTQLITRLIELALEQHQRQQHIKTSL